MMNLQSNSKAADDNANGPVSYTHLDVYKRQLLNHVLSMKIDVLWRNTLVKWMNKDQPKEVLDVATGTGDLAIAVQKGTKAKVVGLDLSQQMLNVGIDKIKKLNLNHEISMQKGDAENLPFESNKFDAVSVAFGVRNFENLEKGCLLYTSRCV